MDFYKQSSFMTETAFARSFNRMFNAGNNRTLFFLL